MSQSIQKFEYLPWFDVTFKLMVSRLDQGSFPQSLLMTGERDIGKKCFAQDLAKTILCLDRESERACGACQSCIWFEKAIHPDFLLITSLEKSHFIKIDQIRQLTQFVQMTSETGRKVVVIEDADEMNSNAANALLKTLEEPANQCYLILVSHFPKTLPVTITSRCQREVLSISGQENVVRQWLMKQNPSCSIEDIKKIMTIGYGRPLLSQRFLSEDHGHLVAEFEALFIKYLSRKNNVEELSLFITKHWQFASHMMIFWLASALKDNMVGNPVVDELLIRSDSALLLALYDNFIKIIQLESTTIKQDWLVTDWLLSI